MKRKIILISILVTVYISGIFAAQGSNTKFELDGNKSLAIMVYNYTLKDYVSADSIPKGNYELVEDKSYCVNGSKITSYDSALGKVEYSIDKDDKCYLYFEKGKPVIQKVVFGATMMIGTRIQVYWDFELYNIKYVYAVFEGQTTMFEANTFEQGATKPYQYYNASDVCSWTEPNDTIKYIDVYIEDEAGVKSEIVTAEQTVGNLKERLDCVI